MQRTKQTDTPSLEQLENALKRCRYRSMYRRTLYSTAAVLAVVAALSILVTMLWLPVYRIYGSSMTPTLENGQIVVAVKGSSYQRGDLVAFYYGNKLLIKRVIAGPGDVVDIRDNGDVYVNGNYLSEPYATEKSPGESTVELPLHVTDEHWFLLGDNRPVSVDSRDTQIGCVSREEIVGKVILRIWPLDRLGKLNGRTENETK